jgi:hypothetical protein
MIANRIDGIKAKIEMYERAVQRQKRRGKSSRSFETLIGHHSAMLEQVLIVQEFLVERLDSGDDETLMEAHDTPRPSCHHDEEYYKRYVAKRDREYYE